MLPLLLVGSVGANDNRPVSEREPFPSRLSPMLAKMAPLPNGKGEWAFEIKWDGVRALAYANRGEWRMASRRGEDVTARYPELAGIGEDLAGHAVVLDGEVCAFTDRGRPSFQLLQRRMGLSDPKAIATRLRETPVTFVAFDLLHLDGANTRPLLYPERRELLEGLELDGPHWQTPSNHPGPGTDLLEAARRRGLEGVVAKRLDSPYRPGKRTGEWTKARIWKRQEFVIGGYIPGEGSRSGRVGSLLVGFWDKRPEGAKKREPQRLVFAGGVGSGLRQSDIDFLTRELTARRRDASPFEVGGPKGAKARTAVYCEPELVCEVSWTEWTKQGTLRQPAFKGLRTDKDPRDVVREA
jgi:bifunctional non-homologous end joining protein LigD